MRRLPSEIVSELAKGISEISGLDRQDIDDFLVNWFLDNKVRIEDMENHDN